MRIRLIIAAMLCAAFVSVGCKGSEAVAPVAPVAPVVVDVSTPVNPPQMVANGVAVTGPVRMVDGLSGKIEGNGAQVAAATPLAVGNIVQVLWSGSYYQGQIVAADPAGTFKIHYVGWSTGWDESVPRERLKVGPVAAVAGAPSAPPPPPPPTPAPAAAGGTPATAATAFTVGQAISVEWNGRWYPSTVVAVQPDGTVRIHYVGWADSWDENVARSRIKTIP